MADFTTLLGLGCRRYRDKYCKKRRFGECEMCEYRDMLINYEDEENRMEWSLCATCYDKIVFSRIWEQK